jgi:DNA-binding response OmpR family regulator
MMPARHVLVVHHAPMVVDALDMTLRASGFTVHPAATYRVAKALLSALGEGVVVVVVHADMPNQPKPGSLLRLVRMSHPGAALVVLSARARSEIGPLPRRAVLLREPFDRAELMHAIAHASDPRIAELSSANP